MKRKFRPFLTVLLGLMMSVVGISTASAATLNSDGVLVDQNGTDPVKAAITKILQMPVGTAIPNSQFIYKVAPISVDGDAGQKSIMPALGAAGDNTVTINFAPGASAVTPALASGDDAYFVESGDIFANMSPTFFPHAGVYVYEITEKSRTNATIDSDPNQELTYSQAKYTLNVYVGNAPSGTGTYIYALGTVYNTTDDNASAGDVKVDPTPGTSNISGKYSQMMFTNTYVHTNGPVDPEDPITPPVDPGDPDNATLTVSKTVAGTLGDKTAYFDLSATITPPALQQNVPTAYRAYVVDSANAVVTTASNGTIAGSDEFGNYLEIAPGSPTSFKLMDGQRLVVVNAAVGSTYTVTESASDHVPSVIVTTKSVVTTPTPSSAAVRNPLDTGSQHVGEPTNTVAFTNTRDLPALTGLSMNDLPFVGLIVLTLGALGAYIVVKSRKAKARG